MIKIANMLNELRNKSPLIHHITNNVTVSECANITLCMGGLPVMAYDKGEVEEMVQAAGALVLNIGTLSPEQVEAMILAGKKANTLGIPVVFDPVGVGATSLRTDSAKRILSEVDVSYIKGNQAEISILSGREGQIKGVESVGEYSDILDIAKELARKSNSVVIVSGKQDVVTDDSKTVLINNGHHLMGSVVGTGCMAASVIGCFAAVSGVNVESAVAALVAYEVAGEIAAEMKSVIGPGSYKVAIFDAVKNLDGETVEKRKKIKFV